MSTHHAGSHDARVTKKKPIAHAVNSEESSVSEATERLVEEGTTRIRRPLVALITTGVMGGLEIGIGLLAKYIVVRETGNELLGSIAFSIAFVILLLAHSELFTEGFLVPVSAVVAGKASLRGLLRFWAGTALGNLIGAAIIMWILVKAYPGAHEYFIEEGTHYSSMGLSLSGFLLAALGGMMLTLVTRMHQHSEETMPQVISSMIGGSMLAGTGMLHSVLDTLYIFGGMFAGADISIVSWLGFVWWVALGNMAGGLLLVSGIRFVRARGSIQSSSSGSDREKAKKRASALIQKH
ncbi:formate/nitrite transporter family protein [Corynebacterium gerontici]|uniref:Inner membrane protein YfdC n=1 Tax=Corynebacterium gerontici TaxID=2079234 RepID=A0A3G6IXA9_9CORY|nr:formate/nitrite transporter family protein [Corynebacterium gerontici]AZA10395.1 Inner membrane protein YfdC [Corynebacterium gerontici]